MCAMASVNEASLHLADRRRARSFAGLLLTTIEGAYIRGRAERSTRAFDEAASLLGDMAETISGK